MKIINAEDIHDNKEAEDERLKTWCNMLWLRQATALFKANELKHLARFLPFKEPAADLGMGDGTHSAMICGARFDPDFDMYMTINTMDTGKSERDSDKIHFKDTDKEEDYYRGGDPYLHFNKEDYEGKVKYTQKPINRFAWGMDIAPELVEKAKMLDLYDQCDVGDLSKPLEWKQDKFFKTIYSNVTYWMDNKVQLFKEHHRILTDDGVILMMAQDPVIHEELALTAFVRNNLKHLGHSELPQWVKEVDRGRIAQTTGKLLTPEEWGKIFDEAELEIIYHGQYMSRDAYWQYDMDQRETFPADSKLLQKLRKGSPEEQQLAREWKEDRVSHFFKKYSYFYHNPGNWQNGQKRALNFFALKKKGQTSWADNQAEKYQWSEEKVKNKI